MVDREWQVEATPYTLLWMMLESIGQTAPPPMVARAEMKAALAMMENENADLLA